MTLLAYWALALPVGACLGFGIGIEALGVRGFWVGLIIALVVIALILTVRFAWLAPRDDRVRLFAQR